MKTATKEKLKAKCGPPVFNGVDSHKWANKMELQRLISGKADVKVMAKSHKYRNCTT